MKKITKLLVLGVICSATLMSCKKDYTCSCVATINIPGMPPASDDEVITIPKSSKKNAETTCDNAEAALKTEVGSNGTASCTLKEK